MANDELVQPENQIKKLLETVGEMRKRTELMADKRRYIIYYTFGEDAELGEAIVPETEISKKQES